MDPEGSGRSRRDDADDSGRAGDVDKAFAEIMARWGETAHRDGRDEPADPGEPVRPDEPGEPEELDEPGELGGIDEAGRPDEPGRSHDPAEPGAAPAPERPAARRPRSVEEVFGRDADTGWRVHTPPEEDDGDFVPPRPIPPSSRDVTFWLAVAGIVGGPLWIIYLAVAAPYSSRLWLMLAVAATLGGFALMVMRLPARKDPEEDDGDNGAVV